MTDAIFNETDFLAQAVQCRRGTWTIGALRTAFGAVAPKTNWKMAIRAMVPVERVDIVLDAIEFMAGGRAQVVEADDQTAIIAHPGYYAAVGA